MLHVHVFIVLSGTGTETKKFRSPILYLQVLQNFHFRFSKSGAYFEIYASCRNFCYYFLTTFIE
jgi:hypothetical protein